jgi:hypothetical protein
MILKHLSTAALAMNSNEGMMIFNFLKMKVYEAFMNCAT